MARCSTWPVPTTLSTWLGTTVTAAALLLAACVEDPISPPASQGPAAELVTTGSLTVNPGLSAGYHHTCALKSDGTATCWGDNSYGQSAVPAGLSEVADVDAGAFHTCALKTDGTVTCWGANWHGQGTVPAGLSEAASVDAGAFHTCAQKTDGTVTCWGCNVAGQATVPADVRDVAGIALGFAHSCALKTDGTVTCWGSNSAGQSAVPAGLSGVADVALGESHTCALKTDRTLTCWGHNGFGQATVPVGLSDVSGIALGILHTCALKSDGTVSCWGYDEQRQVTVPVGLSGVADLDAGENHTCALKTDGTVTCWGEDGGDGRTTVPAGLNLIAQPGATPVGTNVVVEPVDPVTGASPASLTFSNVTSPGQTTISASENGAPPPDAFKLGNPPVYYEIATKATFSGDVTVCIQYDATAFRNSSTLRLFHDAGTGWEDVTTSHDPLAGRICGTVTSLSPFALFESAYEFAGFYAPIENSPTVNRLKAGQAVPVKFSLGDNYGLNIFAPGFPGVQATACDAGAAPDALEQQVTAGQSGLSYDTGTDQYTYVWKTDKSWTGCKTLTVRFRDGQERTALFEFTK